MRGPPVVLVCRRRTWEGEEGEEDQQRCCQCQAVRHGAGIAALSCDYYSTCSITALHSDTVLYVNLCLVLGSCSTPLGCCHCTHSVGALRHWVAVILQKLMSLYCQCTVTIVTVHYILSVRAQGPSRRAMPPARRDRGRRGAGAAGAAGADQQDARETLRRCTGPSWSRQGGRFACC